MHFFLYFLMAYFIAIFRYHVCSLLSIISNLWDLFFSFNYHAIIIPNKININSLIPTNTQAILIIFLIMLKMSFYNHFFLLHFFYCCSITVVCIFSHPSQIHLPPPPPPSPFVLSMCLL